LLWVATATYNSYPRRNAVSETKARFFRALASLSGGEARTRPTTSFVHFSSSPAKTLARLASEHAVIKVKPLTSMLSLRQCHAARTSARRQEACRLLAAYAAASNAHPPRGRRHNSVFYSPSGHKQDDHLSEFGAAAPAAYRVAVV